MKLSNYYNMKGCDIAMTQGERILDYIDRFGSISPMEAFSDLGITKLATRISEKTMEERKNRYGETTRYMRYRRA